RAAYAGTAELSVYMDSAAHRAGIATELMTHALARAADLGASTYFGFIFAHNARCIALFQKFGFERWAYLPRVAVLDGVERDLWSSGKRPGCRPRASCGWQAASCPAPTVRRAGRSTRHRSKANGQRGWNRHPFGTASGLATSPFGTIRSRRSVGSATGTAE